ncbi:MAG: hypothetical protein ACRENI_02610 [Gemmatimonadaceae bacterium]
MRRIIIIALLVAAVIAGWMLRERWMRPERPAAGAATGSIWQPITEAGADRARAAIAELESPAGVAFVAVRGADLVSYLYEELAEQLPRSAEGVQTAVIGNRVYVKASVVLSDLGGRSVLGPLAGLLSDRDTVQFGGTFDVVRPGLAQFRVQEIKLREFAVPVRLIPRLLRETGSGVRPEGIAPDALPLEIPRFIGDVRIADGRITVYRRAP